ncbi:hypothetical protein PINS_up012687 [Pythium insidiosum]|nr:hypothetical protein PINS_up012687 [Pythium insidiosum]
MRQCRHCRRALDAPEPAGNPALGESYVLLPTAISPRGTRHAFASLTQSALHDPWESTSASMRRFDTSALTTSHLPMPSSILEDAVAPRSLTESVIAVATHADLSENILRLNRYHAHCAGMPVTTPVCKECVDAMLQHIDSLAERARASKRSYAGFLQSNGSSVRNEEIDQINEKISFYEDELRALEENLDLMEKEREDIASRQSRLDDEATELLKEEVSLWHALNELEFAEHAFRDGRDSARARMEAIDDTMATTRSENALLAMFSIGQAGPFGTINGFRMGQLPNDHVEWNEINAALGESAFLLVTLASVLEMEFSNFQIVPLGSNSKIIRVSSLRMEYALYGSDQDNFVESHFNLGLGAWVTCLGQMMSHVETLDRTVRLPYKISKHSVGGYSVLFLKNKQAEWTKALRYALTNLKWLLTIASKRWRNSIEP